MRIHWKTDGVRSTCAVFRDLARSLKNSRQLQVGILVILLAALAAILLLEWRRGDLSGLSVPTPWKRIFE